MATVAFDHHTEVGTIRLRISHAGARRFVSLGIQVGPDEWSTAKSRVKKRHPEADRINQRLTQVEQEVRGVVARLESRPEPITAGWLRDEIVEAIEGGEDGPEDFLSFAREFVQGYERRGQMGTFRNYRSVWRKFRGFLKEEKGRTQLPFHRLTERLVREFRTYCYEVRGNAVNTVGKALHVLRTFTRAAMKEGHIDRSAYPFEHITIDSEEVQKEMLTPGEIESLASAQVNGVAADALRYFLFAYYAGGMRFGDVATLRPEHIRRRGGRRRVYYRMEKVDGSVGVPLTSEAEEILSHYDGPYDGGWVFPILDGYGPEHERLVRKKEAQNATVNELLKDIAAEVDLEKRVTFHLARNAAAWRLYKSIGDIYKVSKLLGHSSVQQTEEYLEGFEDDSLDDDFLSAF